MRSEGKKGKGDQNGKGKKGKGKDNAKATEYFAGYSFLCKAWGHMEKDRWWNRSNKSGKDAASLWRLRSCQLQTQLNRRSEHTSESTVRGLKRASMPHNDECRMRIRTRMEQNEYGREGLKKSNRDKIGNWKKLSRGVSKKVQHLDGPRRSKRESLGVRQKEKPRGRMRISSRIETWTTRVMTLEVRKERQKTKENMSRQRGMTACRSIRMRNKEERWNRDMLRGILVNSWSLQDGRVEVNPNPAAPARYFPMLNPEVEAGPIPRKSRNEENGRHIYLHHEEFEFGATLDSKW